jgi:hypothetical protein
VDDGRLSAVRLGDRPHDREPEPGSALGARSAAAREALECVRRERVGEARTFVADIDLGGIRRPPRGEADLAASVPERVVDQIPEGLARSKWVDRQASVCGCIDPNLATLLTSAIDEPLARSLQQLAGFDLFAVNR